VRSARVVAAHHALQARVLLAAPDHFAQQVGLAQERGPLGCSLGGRRESLGEPAGERLEPRGLVAQRAQALHPHHAREFLHEIGGLVFQVRVPVEACVVESRHQHVLVPLAHGGERLVVAVPNGEEAGLERGVTRAFHGEEALVLAERGHDDLARKVEVALVERAGHRGRPFDQVVDDVHELVVGHDPPALRGRRGGDLLAHHAPALGRIGEDLRLAQRLEVAGGLLHVE